MDRIRKHPGQVELLVEKIVKYTLDSDPTLPKLKEQQLLLKKNMSDLNLVIASQNTKALKDLQTLQTLIGPSIKIIIQTRHLITKVASPLSSLFIGSILLCVPSNCRVITVLSL